MSRTSGNCGTMTDVTVIASKFQTTRRKTKGLKTPGALQQHVLLQQLLKTAAGGLTLWRILNPVCRHCSIMVGSQ